VGPVRVRALFGDHVQPLLKKTLGVLPFIGPLFQGPTMGLGILTAGLILAVMIIPFIASVMRDVFEIVPAVLKESAYGLGCTRWEVVRKIVLPYTRTGVVGGVMLGLGRALGETMAVTFVIGNANEISLVAVRSGQLDFLDAGQRIRRSQLAAARVLAVRAGPDPVRDHLRRAVGRQTDAGRDVPQGRSEKCKQP
jgi:ABC-type phosphate transport system permease subunit